MSLTKVINTGIKNAEITGSKINTSSSFSFDVLQANTLTVTNEFQSNSVNSAFNTANAASSYANSSFIHANSAYTEANLKFNSSGGLISGDVTISGNIVPTTDVTYNIGNSSNRIHTIFVGPGSVDIDGIILSNNNGQLTVSGASDFSIQGLPTTSDISDKINLVFDSANSASIAANTPSQVANSASSYANGSFSAANVADQRAVTSGDYANSAYLQANTPSQVANAASSYANGSFTAANVADQRAVTSGVYANSAYAEANVRATTTYVDNAIANLVNSAPATLDTLNELASALNNDPDFATTIATNIGIIGNYSNAAYLQANTPSQVANSASVYANAAYLQANTPSQVANSAGVYANAAYGQANTANIIAQFSFDSSNLNSSNIIIVGDYANSAFSEANAAWQKAFEVEDYAINVNYHAVSSFNQANTADQKAVTSGVYANSAFLQANTPSQVANSASSYANGSFAAANVADQRAVTSGDYANSAFNTANNATDSWVRDAANSASSYANSGFSLANTANTLAQAAFDAANTGSTDAWVRDAANSASSYANSGYSLANTANLTAQAAFDAANNAVDTWVRDAANSASSYANSGFGLANTANTLSQSAYDAANSASSYANSAYETSNNKLSTTGGTISGDLNITGNLVVLGNATNIAVSDLRIDDALIQLAANNETSDALDIGFFGHYSNDAGVSKRHTGLVRDATNGLYYLFYNYEDPSFDTLSPNNTIDVANSSFRIANLNANLITNTISIRGYDPIEHTNVSFSVANSGSSYANAAFVAANTANITAQAAFNAANNAVDTWVRDAANSASSYANSSYIQANTPSQVANAASSYANGAFASANTADQKAVTSGNYANSAYLQANTPSQTSNSASSYANGAFALANTANTLAQAAYDQANTGGGGGGGSGLFNPLINVATGYGVTSSLANAVVFSANAIVHSIYLTNISNVSTSNIQVTGDFTPSGTSNVSIFHKIPLPYRSSVEMLKKPQIVKTNDILKLQSFNNDVGVSANAYAIIVYETTTETNYERVGKLVTDAYSNMYTSTSNPSVIESIKLVNQDPAYGNHAVTVVWTNSANTLQGYFTKELILPANSTIELCETPKYMNAGDKFDAWATTTNVISIFVSAKKII